MKLHFENVRLCGTNFKINYDPFQNYTIITYPSNDCTGIGSTESYGSFGCNYIYHPVIQSTTTGIINPNNDPINTTSTVTKNGQLLTCFNSIPNPESNGSNQSNQSNPNPESNESNSSNEQKESNEPNSSTSSKLITNILLIAFLLTNLFF
ncbi:hypothetical protein ACTFIZ_012725 [Dictyostelium cf. discoideum]